MWAQFYEAVRDELFVDRPWLLERSVAEHLYRAWCAGLNCGVVRDEIAAERRAHDPRKLLLAGSW